jgi:hypothetical protein
MILAYVLLIAVVVIPALATWVACCNFIDQFFGWSLYGNTKWDSARGCIVVLAFIAVSVAAAVMVFVPERHTAAGWLAAASFVSFLVGPVARFDKDHPAWLPAYDVLTRLSLIGSVGWAMAWVTSTGDGTLQWTLGITSGSALLVLCLLGIILRPLRIRRQAARLRAQHEKRVEERRAMEKRAKERRAKERRRALRGVPPRTVRLPGPATYQPADLPITDNASAQRAMSATACRECGGTGYDVETYAIGGSSLWYLGRCPSCGHRREFHYG